MTIESATYIADLVPTNPPGTDNVSEGDNIFRLMKTVLQNTFPSASGVWTALAHTWTERQTFTGTGTETVPIELISTNADAAAGPILSRYRNSASPVAGDDGPADYYFMRDSAGNKDIVAAFLTEWLDPTSTSEDSQVRWGVVTAGSFAYELVMTGAALFPNANGGLSLGTVSAGFANAFLSFGSTLDFGASDVVITHSNDLLTITGGALSLTIAGVFTAGTIELGNVSDTTISRVGGGGDIAVEGNRVFREGGADVPLADGGTGMSVASRAGLTQELLSAITGAQGDLIYYDSGAWKAVTLPAADGINRRLTLHGVTHTISWST